jgi:uncharacterized protein (TIGR02217 family)
MAFFEVEFPRTISYKAIGGPGFSTVVNQGFSGQEQRNRNWANSRGKWKISLLTPPPSQFPGTRQQFVDLLNAFFDVVGGKADGFRLYDHKDHTGLAQPLITVTGGVQLAISRVIGGRTYVQPISKPITAAVNDYQGNALANTVFLHGTSTPVTVDPTTGLVTGQSAGTLVDFQFHYPVRFDTDELPLQVEESAIKNGAGPIVNLTSIPLIEVLAPNF